MKLDLFKLNNFNYVDISSTIEFPSEFLEGTNIRGIKNAYVKGKISIDYEDELVSDLLVTGTFILPCAITLEDVDYEFSVNIEENMGKFNDFYNKNKNILDILPFIWENIVSEVPIRVVKDGARPQKLNGEGWELVSDDESLRKE